MILSMVPMNAFGAPVEGPTGRINPAPRVVGAGLFEVADNQQVVFEFNLGALELQHVTAATLIFELNEDATFVDGIEDAFLDVAVGPNANQNFANLLGGPADIATALTWESRFISAFDASILHINSDRNLIMVQFIDNGVLPLGIIPAFTSGPLQILLPINIVNSATDLSPTLYTSVPVGGGLNEAVRIFPRVDANLDIRLDRYIATRNVSVSVAEPRYFSRDVLPVPHVRFSENQFGNFGHSRNNFTELENWENTNSHLSNVSANSQWTMVRLEAPAGYEWTFRSGFEPRLHYRNAAEFWGAWPVGAIGENNTIIPSAQIERRIEFVNNSRRDVVYIRVPTPTAAFTGNLQRPRQFEIRNLHLVTDTARLGNVYVHAATVYGIPWGNTGAEHRVVRPGNTGPYFRAYNLHVGTRVDHALAARVISDVPEMRTGYLGASQEFSPILGAGNLTEAVVTTGPALDLDLGGHYGLKTAVVEVRELAPGAWGSFVGDIVEFSFDQPGVAIVGVAARVGYGDYLNNLFPRMNNEGNDEDSDYWYHWEGGFMPFAEHRVDGAVMRTDNVHLTPQRARITVPPIVHNNDSATEERNMRLREMRTLEVVFWISVAGGWEARNPGESIEVTIGGAGGAGIPAAQRTLAVGEAHDPISIRLVDGETALVTDVLSTVANKQISDIEITVYEPHLLREGSMFSIRMGGVELANRALGLHIHAESIRVEGEGLVIGTPVRFGAAGASATVGSGFNLPISRIPDEEDNDGPVRIIIENVVVSGTVIPGVEYHVVVSGGAVAENEYTGNVAPGVGRFAEIPYHVLAGEYEEGILIHPDGPNRVNREDFRLWEGMEAIGEVEVPFFWHHIITSEGRALRIAQVNPRAFAMWAGLDVDWDPAGGTAVVSGADAWGNFVSLSVTTGSPFATIIRGTETTQVDIATAVHFQSGPAGSVMPEMQHGRSFLPARFLAETFGYAVVADGNVVIIR
jgi:hypothetical protein